ncbi:ATP-grasp domain-containing protein [Candidatus Saccharibacteria bacterium]|nr:ATP-grasp domain-containing protein [Candidatus Saccharibacteria bacterium]
MKKLVVIGANDFQNQLILKAKSLGYETHVFAWADGAVGEKTADYFYPISIVEKDQILEKCREIKPDGVCSIASDLAAITVDYVSENLGLPCNSTKTTPIRTNKYAMREAMKKAGVATPGFIKVTTDPETWKIDDLKFPLIVKPTDRSGSRGITKIFEKSELKDAVEYATKDSFEKSAIIEEFIDGDEYSCECISQNGEHHFLAFTKKYTTGSPNFIETGHAEPSDLSPELQEKIKPMIFKALDALDIKNSASHSEFKVDKSGNFGIIEIGGRMGGDCIGSDLVELSTGYDFVKMVIDVAAGNKLDFTKTRTPEKVAIKFVFTKEDLDECNKFAKEHPERIIRISEMETENFGKTTDSGSRIGYYIYKREGE